MTRKTITRAGGMFALVTLIAACDAPPAAGPGAAPSGAVSNVSVADLPAQDTPAPVLAPTEQSSPSPAAQDPVPPVDPQQTETAQTPPIDPVPPGAAPGTCWHKSVTPATVETVTETVQLTPAQDGATAVYQTVTEPTILEPRLTRWFETPCREDLTPGFITSVQRALTARALYDGPLTGEMDTLTRAAIAKFQTADGIESDVISIVAAQRLGLWEVPVE